MNPPNVVCLVLDCLRADAVTTSDAPTISSLAERNLSFDACITPANWSLPAHVSLFNGEWPHDHGLFRRDHYLDGLPLINTLKQDGYETVGASANVFVSSTYRFDRGFDRFYETRRPLNSQGLNPFANVRRLRSDGDTRPSDYIQTFFDSIAHDHPVASVDNFARSVLLSFDRRFGLRRYVPFLDDERYGFLTRAADRTTEFLVDEFERTADRQAPLFAFANYMNTHYPYEPPEEHFREVTDGKYDLADLRSIEPDISHSRVFRDAAFAGTLDEDSLELVRAAYRAEVRSVDKQVSQLLEALDEAGIREETVVVITADHGECLGETDLRGERVMGHFDALSEDLWTVPLIIANPKLNATSVDRRVSLKDLFELFTGDISAFLDTGGREWDDHFGDGTVFFELPAGSHDESSLQSYDYLPDQFVDRVATTHTVVGFDGEWLAIADSNGELTGFRDGDPVDVSSVPVDLRDACEDAVAALTASSEAVERGPPEDVAQQLEDLGYV
jgi:arylsulfatase A-like enzyme